MEAHLDLWKIIWQAGPVVKLVLFILAAASLFSWAIVLVKWRFYKNVKADNELFISVYKSADSMKEVLEKTSHIEFSPLQIMFDEGYSELIKIKDKTSAQERDSMKSHFATFGVGILERALKKGVNRSNAKLESNLSVLASIGSVTPFVGLFGTVWGIINSFTGLASGGATLDAVAPGIAEALVATAVGLAAAIPAVWFFNHFNGVASRMNSEMENFGQDFLNLVERTFFLSKD